MGTERRRDPSEVMRDEMLMKEKIASLLREGPPRTIPEIADVLRRPAREVTLWVMALRRYGVLEEIPKPKADDYYRYKTAKE